MGDDVAGVSSSIYTNNQHSQNDSTKTGRDREEPLNYSVTINPQHISTVQNTM